MKRHRFYKFTRAKPNRWATILITFVLVGCVNITKKKALSRSYKGVEISKVLACHCDIRALAVGQKHIFFAGSQGEFGYINSADNSLAYEGTIKKNGTKPDFRGLAHTPAGDFILSSGNPALIYKTNYFGKRKQIFTQTIAGTFYDAIAFWNEEEGIAIGDPIGECMSFLITRDSGHTWDRLDCENLPEAKNGEVAFAASNSNISLVGDKTWVLSGGKTSRVYFSPDKGKTWKVYNTPLISNTNTTGGYSMDFYNDKIGIIVGGDYTKPHRNKANKAITQDGGKTWDLVASGCDPGYKSAVKFVPHGKGKEIVTVGPTGISYSNDQGETWEKLSDKPFYTLHFLNDFTAYAAGKGGIVQLSFVEESPSLN